MYKLINWYIRHFSFPKRGLKYFISLLKVFNLTDRIFTKKIHTGQLLKVSPADHIQKQVLWYGYYEKEIVLTWERFIENSVNVIDAGANIGYYTVLSSRKAKNVFAFEPSSVNGIKLNENIRLNGLTNVSVIPAALADKNGCMELYLSSRKNSGMTSLKEPENFSGQTEYVEIIRFDDWAIENNIDHVSAVKIDVEGAELKVLAGMKATIEKSRPVFFIEVRNEHLSSFGNSSGDIYQFFEAVAYVPYQIVKACTIKLLDKAIDADAVLFIPAGFQFPAGIQLIRDK